jgi:hypothetical protein
MQGGRKTRQKEIFVKGVRDIVDDYCHKTSGESEKEPWPDFWVAEGYLKRGQGIKGVKPVNPVLLSE